MEENPPVLTKRTEDLSVDIASKPKRSILHTLIVWIVVLLVFAGLIAWVVRHQAAPQAGSPAARRAMMMGGPVTVIPATAHKGDIGVYQEAIGTVTPVYTSSVASQVT